MHSYLATQTSKEDLKISFLEADNSISCYKWGPGIVSRKLTSSTQGSETLDCRRPLFPIILLFALSSTLFYSPCTSYSWFHMRVRETEREETFLRPIQSLSIGPNRKKRWRTDVKFWSYKWKVQLIKNLVKSVGLYWRGIIHSLCSLTSTISNYEVIKWQPPWRIKWRTIYWKSKARISVAA